jgi:hypothetical protein
MAQQRIRDRGGRRPDSRRSRRTRVGFERLEGRALLAGISGFVHRSVDVSGLAPNDPSLFAVIPGVTVRLDDGTQQVTDSTGAFSFADVAPGRREVSVVLPTGFLGTSAQSLSSSVTVGTDDVTGLNFALAERNRAIVQNLFELVLQRPAAAEEFSAAVNRLDAGGTVAAEFGRLIRSQEFRTVVQPVAGFVQAMFPGVLAIEAVRSSGQQQQLGMSQDATVQGIMASQKFVAAHGDTASLTAADYVRFLYRQLLNRAPTARQLDAGVSRLQAGTTRGQFALDLVATAAFQARSQLQRSLRGAITYVGVLGREGTSTEVRAFTTGTRTAVQLATTLSRSAEFRGLDGFTSTAFWDVMAMGLAVPVPALDRLQQYNPKTQAFDIPVTAGSVTSSGDAPANVYVVSHGWAPGQSEAVLLGSKPGDPLKSWNGNPPVPTWLFDPTAQVASTNMAQTILDCDPTAIVIAYSWLDLSATPMASQKTTVTLEATGTTATIDVGDASQLSAGMKVTGAGIQDDTTVMFIVSPTQVTLSKAPAQPLTDVPLTFSGTDLESTIRSLLYVGQSESRTQWAGLMLAEGVKQMLAPSFFGAGKGLLHLMGHSHGAKVATVATVALEAADVPVSQLTLFDSPETGPTKTHFLINAVPLGLPGAGGGQNFVWRFLQELPTISRTPVTDRQATGGTFVENYYSLTGFGQSFGGFDGLDQVVDVQLRPAELFNPDGGFIGDLGAAFLSHEYPPAWYAQASLQNPAGPASTQNGLSWSPLIQEQASSKLASFYDQFPQSGTTTPGEFAKRQFEVTDGGPPPAETVKSYPLSYALQSSVGSVTDTGSSLSLGVGGDAELSMASIGFVPYGADVNDQPVGTGLELDVSFSGVDPSETVQLMVAVHGMAVPQLELFGKSAFMSGSTGFMTVPLLTLDGGSSGSASRKATVSLDVFRQKSLLAGAFATAANPVPQLTFSLVGSAGAQATATVTAMRQFGTPTASEG